MTRWEEARGRGREVAANTLVRLLPGEDPTTDLAEDVTHWVSVYTELLDSGRGFIDGGNGSASTVDHNLVRAHLRRLESRLDFWLQKRARLAG